MEKENFSPEQSLRLINQMIVEAKKEISDNGFLYLLWGWLVFVAAVTHYVLIQFMYPYAFITWPVLMPLGGLISVIYGMSQKKKHTQKAKTWVDHVFMYTWIAFGAGLLVTLSVGYYLGWEVIYPFIIMLYGIGTFISGGIMKFKPLIIGGICCWLIAAIAFYATFEYQLLLLMAAIVIAYIIPGHILKYKSAKNV